MNRTMTAVAIAGAIALPAIAGCSSSSSTNPSNHGTVVARLTIPFTTTAADRTDVIKVDVRVGQRFSVKVGTSDGFYFWRQSGHGSSRMLRLAGNFDQGSCPSGTAGCHVSYFHTLQARHAGRTILTWKYHDQGVVAATVRLDITVA